MYTLCLFVYLQTSSGTWYIRAICLPIQASGGCVDGSIPLVDTPKHLFSSFLSQICFYINIVQCASASSPDATIHYRQKCNHNLNQTYLFKRQVGLLMDQYLWWTHPGTSLLVLVEEMKQFTEFFWCHKIYNLFICLKEEFSTNSKT